MSRPIHFEIHAENPERAMKFYTDVFGWKFVQWGKEADWLAHGADTEGNLFGMMQMDAAAA